MEQIAKSTLPFQPGDSLQGEFFNIPGQLQKFTGHILKITDTQMILNISEAEMTENIKQGTELTLIYEHHTSRETEIQKFISYYMTSNPVDPKQITIAKPQPVRSKSYRQFFRCDVSLPFQYFHQQFKYIGTISNLSASGLYAVIPSNPELQPGMTLPIQFTLPTVNGHFSLVGEVIRIQILNSNHYGMALNFLNASDNIQAEIVQYLFKRQHEMNQHKQFINLPEHETGRKISEQPAPTFPPQEAGMRAQPWETIGEQPVSLVKTEAVNGARARLEVSATVQSIAPSPAVIERSLQKPYYTGLGRRLSAFIIDMVILAISLAIITGLSGVAFGIFIHPGASGNLQNILATTRPFLIGFGVVIGLALYWLYFSVTESSGHQGSVGKRLLQIEVADLRGGRISFTAAGIRSVFKIISGASLGIGLLMAGFNPKHRCLHDYIARTVVINRGVPAPGTEAGPCAKK